VAQLPPRTTNLLDRRSGCRSATLRLRPHGRRDRSSRKQRCRQSAVGGQRFRRNGSWHWSLRAAHILKELLTGEVGRRLGARRFTGHVKGEPGIEPGPESFNVLVRELQSLCLDVEPDEAAKNRQGKKAADSGTCLGRGRACCAPKGNQGRVCSFR